jgi:hypothetical protein
MMLYAHLSVCQYVEKVFQFDLRSFPFNFLFSTSTRVRHRPGLAANVWLFAVAGF